ncbi:hypothetical protein DKP78_26505, partial [Enterococcus faecium]
QSGRRAMRRRRWPVVGGGGDVCVSDGHACVEGPATDTEHQHACAPPVTHAAWVSAHTHPHTPRYGGSCPESGTA